MLTKDEFDWDGYAWISSVTLPSLTGHHSSLGPYETKHSNLQSGGIVDIAFAPEGRGDSPLLDSEIDLVNWYLDREEEVLESALRMIYTAYPDEQEKYGYTEEEQLEYMPAVKSLDDIRSLVGLRSVNVHQISNETMPYIGLLFACTWDNEHGLGVLLNGMRVVEIGGADVAILLWIAERDAKGRE